MKWRGTLKSTILTEKTSKKPKTFSESVKKRPNYRSNYLGSFQNSLWSPGNLLAFFLNYRKIRIRPQILGHNNSLDLVKPSFYWESLLLQLWRADCWDHVQSKSKQNTDRDLKKCGNFKIFYGRPGDHWQFWHYPT